MNDTPKFPETYFHLLPKDMINLIAQFINPKIMIKSASNNGFTFDYY